MKKILQKFTIIFFLLPFAVYAKDSKVEAYVSELVEDSLTILNNDSLSKDQKITKLKKTMLDHLDTRWMAKYTLGREVKSLEKEKLEKFIKTYRNYLAYTYTKGVAEYKGQVVEIKSYDKLSEKFFMVKTHVIGSGDNPIHVDYLTKATDGHYIVRDIVTEGISLINSQRSEYSNMIENEGIDSLISELEKKTNPK